MRTGIIASLFCIFGVYGDFESAPFLDIADAKAPTTKTNPPRAEACSDWKFFLDGEYLCWWWKKDPQPVVLGVTTGSSGVYPLTYPQVGQPGVSVIFGGKDVGLGAHQGFQIKGGARFNDDWGVGGRYFQLMQNSVGSSVSSSGGVGTDSIYVPFNNSNPSSPEPTYLSAWAFPGVTAGGLSLSIANSLKGVQANFLGKGYCSESIELYVLGGFTWWELKDRLVYRTHYNLLGTPGELGSTKDLFAADNNFYGGLIGLDSSFHWNWFWMNLVGKVSLGSMRSMLDIEGVLYTNDFNGYSGPVIPYPGGVFALPSNIGVTNHNGFAVIPEAEINLGFEILEQLSLTVGYSFMYVNKVLWAGNGMDGTTNPQNGYIWTDDFIPTFIGPDDPQPRHTTESFWVQGISAGIALIF